VKEGKSQQMTMFVNIFGLEIFRTSLQAIVMRSILLTILSMAGSLSAPDKASAAAILEAAAATADAGVSACSNNSGKMLYECVANVLDRMSSDIARAQVPETQRALQTAASRLRAATTKSQALSAITQCQAAIAGALRKIRAANNAFLTGWGDSGLAAVVSVLSRAAKLIQTKG
jgi:hypothetical protein